MNYKKYMVVIALVVGIATFLLSIAMDVLFPEFSQSIGMAKYSFVGLGAGLAGASASKLLTMRIYKRNPALAKQAAINEHDERLVSIRKTAGYYMWYVTLFLLCAMALIFVIMGLMIPTCITIAVITAHIIIYFMLLMQIAKKL